MAKDRGDHGSWYDTEKLQHLLEHYVGGENVEVLAAIDSNESLQTQLARVEATGRQHILPLNVNALTKELGQNTNHWVGLYITHNGIDASSGIKRVIVDYVDPMGHAINFSLKIYIEECLSSLSLSAKIKEPLLGKPIQYAKQISPIELQGNTDDCGPILVYVMACLSRSLGDYLPKFTNEATSHSFGSFLREGYYRGDVFQSIYNSAIDRGHHAQDDSESKEPDISVGDTQSDALIASILATEGDPSYRGDRPIPPKAETPSTSESAVEFVSRAPVEILTSIRGSFTEGIGHYNDGNLADAEAEFVKVLRPLLAKPSMKLIHPESIPTVKDEILGAMYHLGEIYLRNGDVVREKYGECIDNHSKAAAIFQYCSGFAAKYETTIDIEGRVADSQYFLRRAYDVEREFLVQVPEVEARAEASTTDAGSGSYYENYQQKIDNYKSDLANTRTVVGEMLDDISDLGVEQIAERSAEVEDIYQTSSQFFVSHQVPMSLAAEAIDADLSLSTERTSLGFIQRLLSECYDQLGNPPQGCEYSIIGLGSLALGTMTPWSDLEFAVLINKDREDYKEYFRNLTKLLHIKIINLGETPLRSVGIESLNNFRTAEPGDDWFWDDVIDSGFSFDSVIWRACKDPLGRQGGYKVARTVKNDQDVEATVTEDKPDYELILTPEEMAAMQFAEADGEQTRPNFASDRYLVQALRSNALIDGSQSLLDEYRSCLHTSDPEQLQILQSQSMEILKEDVDKFSLKLGDEEEGKLMKVKNGIYRLGDRVVNALANYYGIDAEAGKPILNVWQKIEAMRDREVISVDGAQHLKEALSIATELRLRTYANNEAQGEGMSTYVPAVEHLTEGEKHKLLEKTFHIKDTSILHHFYYVMLRVQDVVKVFCEQDLHNAAEMILASDDLYGDSNYHKGMVHARFLEYDRAIEHLEAAKAEKPKDLQTLKNLYFVYSKIEVINKAIDIAQKILKLESVQNQDNPSHPGIADSYGNLGNAYNSKGDYDAAIEAYKKALEIFLVVYDSTPNHPYIATSYNNLGNTYADKGDYDAAIEAHKKALEIRLVSYSSTPNHPYIAGSYNNLGNVYNSKGDYDAAIQDYKKALEIFLVVYNSTPNHPDIATSYNNLGNVYNSKGEYDAAIQSHNKALEIRLVAYATTPNHPYIATSYNNLGNTYADKGEYDAAIQAHDKALEIFRVVYASTPNHPNIAGVYGNLGNAYANKGEYQRALLYTENGSFLCNNILVQLGNQEFLADNQDRAREYYTQINLPGIESKRWYQCIGQVSSLIKDKFWLLNYAANIKLSGCNFSL